MGLRTILVLKFILESHLERPIIMRASNHSIIYKKLHKAVARLVHMILVHTMHYSSGL